MKCNLYQLTGRMDGYLFLPADQTLDSLPLTIRRNIGAPRFLMEVMLCEQPDLPGDIDTKAVIKNVQSNGFHLEEYGHTTNTVISRVGAAIGTGILVASLGLGMLGALASAATWLILAKFAKPTKGSENATRFS